MAVAYLGLGGNVGDSLLHLNGAIESLNTASTIEVIGVSQFYRTTAVGGPPGQADFLNAAVKVETSLCPRALLDFCLSVESRFGRTRGFLWGPRTLDIDLLLYDDVVVDETELTVPHPLLRKRLFVLVPLSDIAPPDMELPPDCQRLIDVLDRCSKDSQAAIQDYSLAV